MPTRCSYRTQEVAGSSPASSIIDAAGRTFEEPAGERQGRLEVVTVTVTGWVTVTVTIGRSCPGGVSLRLWLCTVCVRVWVTVRTVLITFVTVRFLTTLCVCVRTLLTVVAITRGFALTVTPSRVRVRTMTWLTTRPFLPLMRSVLATVTRYVTLLLVGAASSLENWRALSQPLNPTIKSNTTAPAAATGGRA